MDQIHDFAVTRHREFVIKHLEPWLCRAEELEKSPLGKQHNRLKELEESQLMGILSGSYHESDSASSIFQAEWVSVKEASKETRNAKALQTRIRNRLARRVETSAEIGTPGPILHQKEVVERSEDTLITGKRGRGRPRKVNSKSEPKRSQRLAKKRKV